MTSIGKHYNRAPSFPAPRAELLVKPDLLRVSLSVSLESEAATSAFTQLRQACEQLRSRAQERLALSVVFRPRDVHMDTAATNNKLSFADEDSTRLVLEGWLEAPLAAGLDFWARSALVVSLVDLCQKTRSDSRESKKLPRFDFGAVEACLAQPEAHREALLRHTAARIREVAAALGSERAPLDVLECSPVGPVEQALVSVEQVGLSLPVTYRLGVVGHEHPPGGALVSPAEARRDND
jgi:hypothetical protein